MSFLKRKKESPAASHRETAGPDHPETVPIDAVVPRVRVAVSGKVTRMTMRPTSGQPALAVCVSDETGTVTAVWTGRREIGGVTLGRRMVIEGVPMRRGPNVEFTNPVYTLLPR